jgi:hypothetical protein
MQHRGIQRDRDEMLDAVATEALEVEGVSSHQDALLADRAPAKRPRPNGVLVTCTRLQLSR